jgi:hypothetical protein
MAMMIAMKHPIAPDHVHAASAAEEQARKRSDPRERRWVLRYLDLPLTDEIRDAGALSVDELIEMADRPLGGRASRETIEEWWEYTRRRGWLEEHEAGRWRVSRLGREERHERRRRASQPDPLAGARAVTKWVLAVGVIGAAGLLSDRYTTTEIAILAFCAAIVVALLLVALMTKFLDPPVDRWIVHRACDWLEGRRVGLLIRTVPAAEGKVVRLYEESAEGEVSAPAAKRVSEIS